MLEMFRKYQRSLMIVVSVFLFASFLFFGTQGAIDAAPTLQDHTIGTLVDGSDLSYLEVQRLSRFLDTDRYTTRGGASHEMNLCNDGVIRKDILQTEVGLILAREYFTGLKADLDEKLGRAKRFSSYSHPEIAQISVKNIWDHFIPEMEGEIEKLKNQNDSSIETFAQLQILRELESRLHPEMLRRILIHQNRQANPSMIDERLGSIDLGLFGFHKESDWFGKSFVHLVSQFICNVAQLAKTKGYEVSLVEAKGDLIHQYQQSMEMLNPDQQRSLGSFQSHLRSLGFHENEAAQVWQKVLLFRKFFQEVGEAAFVDHQCMKELKNYSHQKALIDEFKAPICLKNDQDRALLHSYILAIGEEIEMGLPKKLKPLEKIAKTHPELVQSQVEAEVALVDLEQLALRIKLLDLWSWQKEHWHSLAKKFSLPEKGEPMATLDSLPINTRLEVDQYSRLKLLNEHPEWIDVALMDAKLEKRSWKHPVNQDPQEFFKGKKVRIENLQVLRESFLLSFEEAKPYLKEKKGAKIDNPFLLLGERMKNALENGKSWEDVTDPILAQFAFQKTAKEIQKSEQKDWMKDEAFMMIPGHYSPIKEADGEVVFFYLKEKKSPDEPLFEQIPFGKQMLSNDAKVFMTEKYVKHFKDRNAIVIPIEKEDE